MTPHQNILSPFSLSSWRQVISSRSFENMNRWLESPLTTNSTRRRLLFRALRTGWDEGAAHLISQTPLSVSAAIQALELTQVHSHTASEMSLIKHHFSPAMTRWSTAHGRWSLVEVLLSRQKELGFSVWEKNAAGQSCVTLGIVACTLKDAPDAPFLTYPHPGMRVRNVDSGYYFSPFSLDKKTPFHKKRDWLDKMEALNPGGPKEWAHILLWACSKNDFDVAYHAISRHACVETRNKDKDSALALAYRNFSRNAQRKLMEALVLAGACVDSPLRLLRKGDSSPTLRTVLEKSDKSLLATLISCEEQYRLKKALNALPVNSLAKRCRI